MESAKCVKLVGSFHISLIKVEIGKVFVRSGDLGRLRTTQRFFEPIVQRLLHPDKYCSVRLRQGRDSSSYLDSVVFIAPQKSLWPNLVDYAVYEIICHTAIIISRFFSFVLSCLLLCF